MNSINESTYFGVPLVMVPQQLEQAFNARRIRRQGAGLMLKSNKLTPKTLRNAVQTILADGRYKENANRLSRDIRSLGGQLRAADEILGFVHGQARPEIRKTA
jgi:UDP:flavonoid glycosyltransferase YjiC (YdhE family)